MAEYILDTDSLVSLNGTIPFNRVSIPCGSGCVVPLSVGILNLKGSTSGRFARYKVSLRGYSRNNRMMDDWGREPYGMY